MEFDGTGAAAREAARLVLLAKILQRGMAQVFFAAQVLHAADKPRLDPLRRRPPHAFGGGPTRSPTRSQSRSRISRFKVMNAEPT